MAERWIADQQRKRFSTMLPPPSTMNGRCFLPALTPYDTRIRTPFLRGRQARKFRQMASVSLFCFKMGRIIRPSVSTAALALAATTACLSRPTSVEAWSSFHGSSLRLESPASSSSSSPTQPPPSGAANNRRGILHMRKQKASDKRTRRLQRSGALLEEELLGSTPIPPPQRRRGSTASPMDTAAWKQRKIRNAFPSSSSSSSSGNRAADAANRGRGRSRKRSQLYSRLSTYNNEFVALLTAEYRAEEAEVLARLEASADDPLGLELSGHALLDMYPERRGNIFSDEVYRLTKAFDATTVFGRPGVDDDADGAEDDIGNDNINYLPPNHKISTNDVLMLTLQPAGSGDFFGPSTLPTAKDATSVECRVLNTGPTYVDVAIPGGSFEAAFGPAPNNVGSAGRGDRNMRLRADRYFSSVPYERMVSALGQITALPERAKQPPQKHGNNNNNNNSKNAKKKEMDIQMDEVLRDAIVSTYRHGEEGADLEQPCDIGDLCRKLARPPLPNSVQLAKQALDFMQSDRAAQFPEFNEPQVTSIGAALTRRLTMIQGPPGTGKTLTAASIAFGFVHQCRNISPHTKVLACAFSNIGADNLAEYLIRLGLKVVRVGKASGVSESLWDYTLDAAIAADPAARKAQEDATKATSNLRKFTSSKPSFKRGSSGQTKRGDVAIARAKREAATTAVKAAIEASNVAATKALREADVIVCTSVGAADARLLAACGIVTDEDEEIEADGRLKSSSSPSGEKMSSKPNGSSTRQDRRKLAPDNLPSLSTPFVIVDEACQSVEPANLIPVTATNSCRSLVMLGDPCQLPPTVRGDVTGTGSSPLSVSLMSRLASTLHQPVIVTAQADKTLRDDRYLNALPTKQAVSLVRYKSKDSRAHVSYRKQYAGSLLLSVQYRMHPSISAFSSAVFYDGLLSTPAFLAQHRPFPSALREMLPSAHPEVGVRFVDVGGRNNERKGEQSFSSPAQQVAPATALGENTSYRNDAEAQEILMLLKDLLRQKNESSERDSNAPPMSIGIVTPYSSQVALIKSLMAADAEFRSLAIQSSNVIEVQSVDGYQGRERDLIIFSAVRSNRQGRLGFLTDWRRMNVALTRAKSALVVFGDMETLRDGDRHWEAFADWCEKMGCVIDAGIDESEANEFM